MYTQQNYNTFYRQQQSGTSQVHGGSLFNPFTCKKVKHFKVEKGKRVKKSVKSKCMTTA